MSENNVVNPVLLGLDNTRAPATPMQPAPLQMGGIPVRLHFFMACCCALLFTPSAADCALVQSEFNGPTSDDNLRTSGSWCGTRKRITSGVMPPWCCPGLPHVRIHAVHANLRGGTALSGSETDSLLASMRDWA